MTPSDNRVVGLLLSLPLVLLSACNSAISDGSGSGASGGASAGAGGGGPTTSGSGASAGVGGSGGSTTSSSTSSGGAPPCVEVPPGVPDNCITNVGAGEHTFACDGLSYAVSVPDACVGCACGLVFDVHGFTMSAAMEEANTRIAALGRARGYVVVQPSASGTPASWNAGVDDPKVFDFMQRTIAALHIDEKRVHFTGFSQGGDMTWRFLCDHSDILASVAPAAFHNDNDDCFSEGTAPPNIRPILYLHGTSDSIVAYSTAITSRDRVIAAQSLGAGMEIAGDDDHRWTRYEGPSGAVFEMLDHDYSGAALIDGHCFPGSTDPGGAPGQFFPFSCDPPNAFTWGEAVMDFFEAHPLP